MYKKKYIDSPEKMWEHFLSYKEQVKNNPALVHDYVGKDGQSVFRKKERPLTDKGFFNFCRNEKGACVRQYFQNQDKLYGNYIAICSRISDEIDQDQIEGGMIGIYNPSITQRLNGLVDKKETEIRGSLNIPNIPDIGSR